MKKVLGLVLVGCALAGSAIAAPIASCGNETGKAYYPFAGDIPADKFGWSDDAITGGRVTLDLADDGKFDLLYLDSTGAIASALKEGAAVFVSGVSETNISVIVAFPGNTTEVYDFYNNTMGVPEYTHIVSKPASVKIPKAAVYVGKCDFINFDGVK